MQNDCIHRNGEAIALVLANTQEQADHAKSLIRAIYAEEPATTHFHEALQHPRELESVMGEPPRIEIGDAEAALAAATHKVDRTFHTPRYNHNPIELHASLSSGMRGNSISMMPRRPSCRLPGRWRRSSTSMRTRCMSLHRLWAAASAPRRCGIITCLPRQRPG